MCAQSTNPFMESPDTLNTPRPSYFHDVFHLVHAYLELLQHTSTSSVPDKGIIKLYAQRMGVLDIDTSQLENSYTKVSLNRLQQSKLQSFANSSILYNIQLLYKLLSDTMCRDLQNNFGDENCLTSDVVRTLNQFTKLQDRVNTHRVQRYDNISSLVQTCHYNAMYPRSGISSSQAIFRTVEWLDKIFETVPDTLTVSQIRDRSVDALKIIFYIGCRYYHLNLLRFSDEIIKRAYDRSLCITDFTLAAVPFDPMLIQSCTDETSVVTKWGIEYLQSLETVLAYFGGVKYAPMLPTESNGNKGIGNV